MLVAVCWRLATFSPFLRFHTSTLPTAATAARSRPRHARPPRGEPITLNMLCGT